MPSARRALFVPAAPALIIPRPAPDIRPGPRCAIAPRRWRQKRYGGWERIRPTRRAVLIGLGAAGAVAAFGRGARAQGVPQAANPYTPNLGNDFVFPEYFGARGLGYPYDDTAAIQEWLTAGVNQAVPGTFALRARNYYCANTVNVAGSLQGGGSTYTNNAAFFGAGTQSKLLLGNSPGIVVTGPTGYGADFTTGQLSFLNMEFAAANGASNTLFKSDGAVAGKLSFRNCSFIGGSVGFLGTNVTGNSYGTFAVHILDCLFVGQTSYCINGANFVEEWHIGDCELQPAAAYAAYISGSPAGFDDLQIRNTRCERLGSTSNPLIHVDNGTLLSISDGCYLEDGESNTNLIETGSSFGNAVIRDSVLSINAAGGTNANAIAVNNLDQIGSLVLEANWAHWSGTAGALFKTNALRLDHRYNYIASVLGAAPGTSIQYGFYDQTFGNVTAVGDYMLGTYSGAALYNAAGSASYTEPQHVGSG
jgi:hypothetical protein